MSEIESVKPVYQFSFTDDNYITYKMFFLNTAATPEDGADHSAPHTMRRDFVRQLVDNMDFAAMKDTWFPLPEHAFLEFLANKGFKYSRGMIDADSDTCWIYIE